ncbi:hypothetical protein [Polyangium jinanense]|uniref:Uncharacterized protein n=1 Tax=Polyangium jinanense TaxID=2829994 RepID=A0A9X3WXY9_9BACT|nr:hypothetical protein [Polyangium jinanense]MDC3953609.1 hypothetical protein [Polyangium jinanense]MDC3979270.1 hypothetical protein [Polyangium jinanense]
MRGNDGAYRDPLQGLRARVQDLASEVEERETMLTDALFEHLPRKLAETLRDGRARARLPANTEAELLAAEATFLVYRDALDRAIELAPDLEDEQRALPQEAPDPQLSGSLRPFIDLFKADIVVETCDAAERGLRLAALALDKNAEVEKQTAYAYRARFHAHDAPFSILTQIAYSPNETPAEVHVFIATSVAAGTPPLRIRPQTLLHGLGKAIGLVREAEVGDERFDDLFLIEAEADVAKSLFGPAVRKALLAVAAFDIPDLDVRGGRAVLHFRFEPNERLIRNATLALAGIRKAPVRVSLLR